MTQHWSFRVRYGGSKGTLFVVKSGHGYHTRFIADGGATIDAEYESWIFQDKDGLEVDLPDPDNAVSRQLGRAAWLVMGQAQVGIEFLGSRLNAFELYRRLPCTGNEVSTAGASVRVGPGMMR